MTGRGSTLVGAHTVADFGTDLLHTTVRSIPGGYEWRRAPGTAAPAPFRRPSDELLDLLVQPGDEALARWAPAAADGPARIYRVHGRESVANRLLTSGPQPELADPLRGFGALLRGLHDAGPVHTAALAPQPPRGLDRLNTWLGGRAPVARAAWVAAELRARLGEDRWSKILGWTEQLNEDTAVTLVHGAPGLGSLVTNTAGRPAELLVGEDLAVAPWYFDLGWAVGEIVELRWQLGGEQENWQLLLEALFEGYGRELGTHWAATAAIRILLHVHDIAAYVGWHTMGFEHYAGFLIFLIDL
ncbi:hypothetical protein FB563_3444 [Streptomyces puniciscabiei]|uniref:Phosphotransferase family enzyme n=1 Tax=Streptomyces puniciscabiei TaxID=164348 RepID=A0A542UH64_9ACTN|nr:hypothetical protein [Streptomyces puniciscabiei]TQK98418.1 hypothetical protein FB563_3444 [Streptomyces puniciscabiei]